jgi:hypothetical protein
MSNSYNELQVCSDMKNLSCLGTNPRVVFKTMVRIGLFLLQRGIRGWTASTGGIFGAGHRLCEGIDHIRMMQREGGGKEEERVVVDGVVQPEKFNHLVDDGREHAVDVLS